MKKNLIFMLSLAILFTSCTPFAAKVPTMTPVGSLSDAVKTIDTFYTLINDSQTEDGLIAPWHMWTLDAQCNPRDQCNLFRFQDRWWPNKVLYQLYDCGFNSVVAEERQYARDADASAAEDVVYWKYQLLEVEGAMMISAVHTVQVPGDDCALIVDHSTIP